MKLRWLALGGAVAVVLAMGSLAWTAERLLRAPDDDAPSQVFEVAPGSSLAQVARQLEVRGLVRSALALEWFARARGLSGHLKSGEYDLSASWPARVVLERIVTGRVKTYELVLPEGRRATEIAARLEDLGLVDAEEFMIAVTDPGLARKLGIPAEGLEGYLYPETYRFPRGLPTHEIAAAMVAQFQLVWGRLEPVATEIGLSQHEIVTMASVVEKETAAPEERPLIAAVFLNRLRRGMRLETDPTVIYGIDDFDGNLTRAHLRDSDNPYNTYRIKGLPPGPIASPGLDALRAVLEPAESDYLYFVSKNDGTHHFSRSYREHANAVNRYQRRGRRR